MAGDSEAQEHALGEHVAAAEPVIPASTDATVEAHENTAVDAAEPGPSAPQHAEPDVVPDFASVSSLAVDSHDSDGDSAVARENLTSSTASVTSSAFEFVEESGRKFHRYKAGNYHLPNDELEQDRLDLQHHLFNMILGGLYLAPIKNLEGGIHNALDIGTGTGIWAIDFADEFPEANVLGVDLSPIQPQYVSPNCRFQIDDVEDPWTYSHKFDFIHGRALVTCFKSKVQVFRSVHEFLRPGGYFEIQDVEAPMHWLDESCIGTRLEEWMNLIMEAAKRAGKDFTQVQQYKTYLEQAGFVDIVEKIIPIPVGRWARGGRMKKMGTWFREDVISSMEGASIGLLVKVLGMSKESVDQLIADVKADFHNPRVHCYANMRIVYGRKAPENA